MFVRTQTNGSRTYLLIVDNQWVDGKVKQRLSEKLTVLGTHARGESITTRSAKIGPALILQRICQACSINRVLVGLLKNRRFDFSIKQAIFLTALHRLFAPGSDRAAEKWKGESSLEGTDNLDLHHLYRAMAWLGDVLSKDQQNGVTFFAPRINKDLIQESFPGEAGATIGQRGHSIDHRRDLKPMVVDQKGNPICSELWPGNTADVSSLVPVVERLQSRVRSASVPRHFLFRSAWSHPPAFQPRRCKTRRSRNAGKAPARVAKNR